MSKRTASDADLPDVESTAEYSIASIESTLPYAPSEPDDSMSSTASDCRPVNKCVCCTDLHSQSDDSCPPRPILKRSGYYDPEECKDEPDPDSEDSDDELERAAAAIIGDGGPDPLDVERPDIWLGIKVPAGSTFREETVAPGPGKNPYEDTLPEYGDIWDVNTPFGGRGSRRWFGTLNKPSVLELTALCQWLQETAVYACGELEMVSTLHFQFYFRMKDAKSFRALKNLRFLKHAWLATAKGTEEQCRKYCGKDGRLVEWHKDKMSPGQGARTELKEYATRILQNGSSAIVQMARENPMAYVYHATGWHRLAMLEDHGRRLASPPQVTVVIGQSGTGKSTLVRRLCDEQLQLRPDTRVYDWNHSVYPWFPDYQDQKIWMCNDFRPQNAKGQPIPMVLFCKMFDVDACKVEDKGGYSNLQCDTFFMSCIVHPKDWYAECANEPVKQLLRRITAVYECYKEGDEFKHRLIGNGEAPYGSPLFNMP